MAVSTDLTSPKMYSSSHCGARVWPHYVVNQSRCASGGIIIVRINVVIFLLSCFLELIAKTFSTETLCFEWDPWLGALWERRGVQYNVGQCTVAHTGEQLYQTQVCRVKCNPYLLTLLTMSHEQLKPMFFALKRNIIPVLSGKQMSFSLPPKQSPSFCVPEIV